MCKQDVFRVCLMWLCFCSPLFCFDSLSELVAYSEQVQEQVWQDYSLYLDWIDPEFSNVYKPQGVLNIMQYMLGLPRTGIVSLELYKSMLRECTGLLERKTCRTSVDCSGCTFVVEPGAKVFVWGPLFGAFHSLVRDLVDLNKRGYIDEKLHVKKGCKLLFLGDVVGRDVYNVETLFVVLCLLKKNPEAVMYLAGEQESYGYWRNFTTKQQLVALRWYDEIAQSIDAFFSRLYKEIYFVIAGAEKEQLLCSYNSAAILKKIMPLYRQEQSYTCEQDTLIAFEAQTPLRDVKPLSALAMRGCECGTFVWGLFSSPTVVHQKYRGYCDDAYVQLSFGKSLALSTVQAFVHKNNASEKFKIIGPYCMLSGMSGTCGLDSFYRFGSSLSLSGSAEVHGTFIKEGILSVVGQYNKLGGVHGTLLRPFLFDDEYIPLFAQRNVRFLHERYGVDVFVGATGSPTLAAYSSMLEKPEIVSLFPSTGSPLFYQEKYKGLVLLRASYATEFDRLTRYIYEYHGLRRFAFFYQDDEFGRAAVNRAIAVLKDFGITDVLRLPYSRDQISFDQEAKEYLEYKPDALGMVAVPKPAIEFLREVQTHNVMGTVIFITSILNEDTFKRFMKNRGIPYSVAHCLPGHNDTKIELVRDYQKAMNELGFAYDEFTLEGYLGAALLVHALEQIKPPFSSAAIIQQIEAWKNVRYKGLDLNFDPKTRQVMDYFWIENVRFT